MYSVELLLCYAVHNLEGIRYVLGGYAPEAPTLQLNCDAGTKSRARCTSGSQGRPRKLKSKSTEPRRLRRAKTEAKALGRRSRQDPFARTPRRVEARPPPEDKDGAEDEGPPKTEPLRPLRPDSAPRANRQPTCAGRQPMCASRQPTWARLFLWPVGLV